MWRLSRVGEPVGDLGRVRGEGRGSEPRTAQRRCTEKGKHLTGSGEELVETQVMFKCVEWRKQRSLQNVEDSSLCSSIVCVGN